MSFDIPPPLEAAVPLKQSLPPTLLARSQCKKVRFQSEADFCQGHPAQIWWTVISGPCFLLVVHYPENFVDMTHFVVLEGGRPFFTFQAQSRVQLSRAHSSLCFNIVGAELGASRALNP